MAPRHPRLERRVQRMSRIRLRLHRLLPRCRPEPRPILPARQQRLPPQPSGGGLERVQALCRSAAGKLAHLAEQRGWSRRAATPGEPAAEDRWRRWYWFGEPAAHESGTFRDRMPGSSRDVGADGGRKRRTAPQSAAGRGNVAAVMISWLAAVYLAVAEPRICNAIVLLFIPAGVLYWLMGGKRRAEPAGSGAQGLAGWAERAWPGFLESAQQAGRAVLDWARDARLPWQARRRPKDYRKGGPRITASRLLARLFDYTLFGLLLMGLALGLGRWGLVDVWFPVKLVLLAVPWMALWTALLGATPGKLLFRLRVRSRAAAGRVGLARALQREWRCLVSGVLLAIPTGGVWAGKSMLVSLFGLRNIWDRRAETEVVQRLEDPQWPQWLRWAAAFGRAAVLAAAGWLFGLGLQPRPEALRSALQEMTGWLALWLPPGGGQLR